MNRLIVWKRLLLWIILTYILLVCVFFCLIVAAYAIPEGWTRNNAKISIAQLIKEGNYPRIMRLPTLQLDNFTDATMLNLSVERISESVIYDSMLNPRSFTASDSIEEASPAITTMRILEGYDSNCDYWLYSRYWHGYMMPLRTLLIFTSINGIRVINNLFLWLLFGLTTFFIYKKIGAAQSLAFSLGMFLCGFVAVPFSMQFYACYYILFLSILFFLTFKLTETGRIVSFFIIGACTAFFDFLTVPILTLTAPLLCIVWMKNNIYNSDKKEVWRFVILCCVIWGVGYVSIFVSKWILAGVITNENVLSDALDSVKYRTLSKPGGMSSIINVKSVFWASAICITVIADMAAFYCCHKKKILIQGDVLFISLIPVLWYCICANHSVVHWWFTYRSLSVTVVVILYMIIVYLRKNNAKIHYE